MQPFIDLIGYTCGWGAKKHGCEDGPATLKRLGIDCPLAEMGIKAEWKPFFNLPLFSAPDSPEKILPVIGAHSQQLYAQVRTALAREHMPVVFGGDHSCAIGTWSSVTDNLNIAGKLGLLWVDAHMDAHTPETSLSGAFHGMPLAALLGHGLNEFTQMGTLNTKLSPEHVCLLGVRSYEEGEAALLETLGVQIYSMAEIEDRGFASVFKEALRIVTEGTSGFGMSIDLDAFDPTEAPGTGSTVKGGLHLKEVLPQFKGLAHRQGFKALEIAEYDPHLDEKHRTARCVRDILLSVMTLG